MDTGNRHSTSPEDCSDGNESLSAPSEFLAEFLSAIMRRQYAEALKYCRLILQYEPHNATARGFYPLLQHKVRTQPAAGADGARHAAAGADGAHRPLAAPSFPASAGSSAHQEMMEQGADDSDGSASGSASRCSSRSRSAGSCASQSSLELDSSDALAQSSASASLSRRTDHSDSAAGCWESTGSEDDNGNAGAAGGAGARADDVHNDNVAPRTDSASSLRRLRAQFTCSIK
ncbi:unnamed protein product [Spodoptera exigua]|nr:unnamed protein product [Spodoptera exigua]